MHSCVCIAHYFHFELDDAYHCLLQTQFWTHCALRTVKQIVDLQATNLGFEFEKVRQQLSVLNTPARDRTRYMDSFTLVCPSCSWHCLH